MTRIAAGLFISLDGVVEAPEQWQLPYFNEEMGAAIAQQLATAETLLLGRHTYEEFAAYWPAADDNPMAERMNSIRKLVASTTLASVTWQHSTLITGDVVTELSELRQQPGGNVQVAGSPTLVRWLLEHKLLDELALFVHPIVVGRGGRLFSEDSEQKLLQLVTSAAFGTGVVSLTYQPYGD